MITVSIFSNYLNHHQVVVADELYDYLGPSFKFVVTCQPQTNELKGAEDFSDRPYCICADSNEKSRQEAMLIAELSDVCIFGACSQMYAVTRAKTNPTGLSFEMGERWLKKGWVNVFSPVLLRWLVNYKRYYQKANFHKLCMSAFAAKDDVKLGCYKGKHYKWGYYTNKSFYEREHEIFTTNKIEILWCARFIDWKHPEMAVQLAKRLTELSVPFQLKMIGAGEELVSIKNMTEQLKLSDSITFLGNVPNGEVKKQMSQSDIFIFTSDKNEGWGVVANEAMNEGCLLIGADEIGAVPYLIKDRVNGLIFKSKNIDSLIEKVLFAINDRDYARKMAKEGVRTMNEVWSAKHAAKSLIYLIDTLIKQSHSEIVEGPCSKA